MSTSIDPFLVVFASKTYLEASLERNHNKSEALTLKKLHYSSTECDVPKIGRQLELEREYGTLVFPRMVCWHKDGQYNVGDKFCNNGFEKGP